MQAPAPRWLRVLVAPALLVLGAAGCGSGISLDEPIEGPVWRLEQLGSEPAAPSDEPQRDAHLQFDAASGRVRGAGGCNRISGRFERRGSALRIDQLAATRMMCAEPQRAAVEAQFLAALQATSGYRLHGPSQLALVDASGRTLAVLGAAPR